MASGACEIATTTTTATMAANGERQLNMCGRASEFHHGTSASGSVRAPLSCWHRRRTSMSNINSDVSVAGMARNEPAPGRVEHEQVVGEREEAHQATGRGAGFLLLLPLAGLPGCLRAGYSLQARRRAGPSWQVLELAHALGTTLTETATASAMMPRSVERRSVRCVRESQARARDQEIMKSMFTCASSPRALPPNGTDRVAIATSTTTTPARVEEEEKGARVAKATSLRTTKYRVGCNQIKQQQQQQRQEQQVRPAATRTDPDDDDDDSGDSNNDELVSVNPMKSEGLRDCEHVAKSLIDIELPAWPPSVIKERSTSRSGGHQLMRITTSENEAPGSRGEQQQQQQQRASTRAFDHRDNDEEDLPDVRGGRRFSETMPISPFEIMKRTQTSSDDRGEHELAAITRSLDSNKPRPPRRGRTRREADPGEGGRPTRAKLTNELFLSKMPSIQTERRILTLLAVACLALASGHSGGGGGVSCQMAHRQARTASPEDDLLAVLPPFAPTRRPAGQQRPQGGTAELGYPDRTPDVDSRAGQMPNLMPPLLQQPQQRLQPQTKPQHTSRQQQQQHQLMGGGGPPHLPPHEQATAASSTSGSKFSRTNELDAFLDEMNHKELQTVASGRPIEDLFQPKPMSMTTSQVASHHQGGAAQPPPLGPASPAAGAHQDARGEKEIDTDEPSAGSDANGPGGLMGSHSEQQIYSDCALILQRTYVKNIEDPKHQLVPFGKTEQACISYKHIDKAIEQAKHKLKFREFAKMRKKAAALAHPNRTPAPPPPPPPFEVIHTSLEPPEDLVAAIGEINMAATQIIADQFDLSNDELLNGLPLIDMSKTKFWQICPLLVKQDLKCEMSRFRTFTGHCNNLKHPTWGAAKTPYARYLPPIHPDGIWVPRKSIVSEISFDLPAPGGERHDESSPSMPAPTHVDGDDPAVDPAEEGSPHRFGLNSIESHAAVAPPPSSPLEDEAELASQADQAELLRESHDDGSHMDMAGSVHFVRRARLEDSRPQHMQMMHHHHQQLMAGATQAHHHHMALAPPPPPPAMPALMHPHQHQHHMQGAATAPIVHQHRTRTVAQDLPSARLVSSIVHRDVDLPNHDFSMLFMSWGQLLDHDMTRAATPPNSIKCCPQPNGEPASKHKLCLPISVPPNDPFYSKFGVQCLDFRRTLAGVRPNCVLGPRVHQNANTSPIDANFVYGSAQATADALRLFKGGRLRDRDWFRAEGLKPLLPAQEIDPDLSCLGRPKDLFCFLAGDVRVNEQTHLTVLHTLYMREHNRIADKLSELNPHWDDERTFQETRHLMAAGVQHVLINEYIPLLIGRKMTELYNLTVATPSTSMVPHGHHHMHHHEQAAYWHGYDPSVTTSVSNSFAAAAFRQGHTFVQSTIDRFNKFHEFVSSEKLRHLFMRPFLLYQPGVMDELVSGMINRQSQSYDPFMTEELAGHLFQPPEAQFGHDLASINLQRGRDQGLPGYNLFREWCGLPRAETFEQLEPYLTNRTAFLYSKLYKHVDDIDLWSAGIAERKLPGAAIGPTFSCIIARQFSNTRRGDRFWYENPGFPSSFTPDQLSEIKKFSLAKLLCTNADDLPTIQRWAFRMAHPVLNPRVDCAQLPEIDLQYWQEE